MPNRDSVFSRLTNQIAQIIMQEKNNKDIARSNVKWQLYDYLLGPGGPNKNNYYQQLSSILNENNYESILDSIKAIYFKYIEQLPRQNISNRDDLFFKDQFEGVYNNEIFIEMLQNPRVVQRMCEIYLDRVNERINAKLNAAYLRPVAQNYPAKQVGVIEKSLSKARRLIDSIVKSTGYNVAENEETINKRHANQMEGIQDIGVRNGKPKSAQEDSVLMMKHPQNPNFRLAVVADGVGGAGNGDRASGIAVQMIKEWFEKLPVEFYNNDQLIVGQRRIGFYNSIINKLGDISDEINNQLGYGPRNNIFYGNSKK